MPRAKRAPIEYTPQFGGGIFRSKETIADELAELEENDSVVAIGKTLDPEAIQAATATAGASRRSSKSVRTNGRTNERSNERTVERNRVRHSFDIWKDQLLGLSEIQAERFSQSGRKPKLGELVQEALDAYIAKERKRTNVRTVER
jgi:hypothetical protein